jgi:hypothetical protein
MGFSRAVASAPVLKAVVYPQAWATPPPPQVAGATHMMGHMSIPPQPSGMVPHSACCAAQVVGAQEPLLVVVEDALLDVAAPLELVALDAAAKDPDALEPVAPPPTPCDPPPDPAPFEEPQAIALTHPAAPARRTDARNVEPRRVPLRRSSRDAVTRPMGTYPASPSGPATTT